MYKLDYKNERKNYLFGGIFAGVAVIFYAVFAFIAFSGDIRSQSLDSHTEATLADLHEHEDSDGDTVYSPEYSFTAADGKTYTCRTDFSTSMRPAQNREVYYDSAAPSDCALPMEKSFIWIVVFVIAFISIFFIVGAVSMARTHKQIRRMKYLANHGELHPGLEYELVDSNVSVNDRTLQAISVKYRLPNGELVQLTGNPRYDHKTEDADHRVDLLIDPQDPTNYYLDFEIKPV